MGLKISAEKEKKSNKTGPEAELHDDPFLNKRTEKMEHKTDVER